MPSHKLFGVNMFVPVTSVADLGLAVRAARKANRLRLDDVASNAGLGLTFAFDVEHGKETVQLGKVLQLLEELGIRMTLDVPAAAELELELLRTRGLKPRRPRTVKPGGKQ